MESSEGMPSGIYVALGSLSVWIIYQGYELCRGYATLGVNISSGGTAPVGSTTTDLTPLIGAIITAASAIILATISAIVSGMKDRKQAKAGAKLNTSEHKILQERLNSGHSSLHVEHDRLSSEHGEIRNDLKPILQKAEDIRDMLIEENLHLTAEKEHAQNRTQCQKQHKPPQRPDQSR